MALQRSWSWELSAPRERLWAYLGDTDWVNRHAGLPRITARYEPLESGGSRRIASFARGPLRVEWEERPAQWQAPEFHEVDRRYSRGPLRSFRSRTSLEPLGERTRVRVDLALEAASNLFEPLLPLVAAWGKRGADRAFGLAERLALREPQPPQGDARRALREFLQRAEEPDLRRIRPYELADRWQLARRDVLRACLSATRAGELNLRWSVLCPGCRGQTAAHESLQALQRENHCPACNVSFDAAFDRSVEVTFDARPFRETLAEDGLYCIASPRRSPHVHAQIEVPARSRASADLTLPPGTYDVHAGGLQTVPFVVSRDERAGELPVTIAEGEVTLPHAVRAGAIPVRIDNATERAVLLRIEEGRWPDTIATAAQVTALQEFRDLFSSEVLVAGVELGVELLAVLFTDLVGSTALYSRTGDAPAFRIVTNHFTAIREIVDRHEGAIVKTIGDAVMAVFADPANCFKAAIELDERVQAVASDGVPLRLRAGMHAGPCIAMRANGRIDYFGTTVNLAARLESVAHAGEVTLGTGDAARSDITPLLRAFGERAVTETLCVKGFTQPVGVVRIRSREGN